MTNESENEKNPRDVIWTDDRLDRRKVAASLTNFINGEKRPQVICLNGQWGTGKTFLLQHWQKELKHDGFKAIYFNAWEDDFCDDPFIALIGQIANNLEGENLEEDKSRLVETAKNLLPIVATGMLNVVGANIDIAEAIKDIKMAELDQYKENNTNRKSLKDKLTDISTKVHEETKRPLVFIVDELDRCRPTFAVELLERVKHIFDVPNMVFVIGVHREELKRAISSVYGGIDTDIYLRRFFDVALTLPETNTVDFARSLIQENISPLFNDSPRHSYTPEFEDEFSMLLASSSLLSLRDIEQCVQSMTYVGEKLDRARLVPPMVIGTAVLLRLINYTIYCRFIRDGNACGEAVDHLYNTARHQTLLKNEELEKLFAHMEAQLHCTMNYSAIAGLTKCLQDGNDNFPESLSSRVKNNREFAQDLQQASEYYPRFNYVNLRQFPTNILNLIELSTSPINENDS